jgi:Nucleotidyl transferase AbiEii toxin, Type IV TA system
MASLLRDRKDFAEALQRAGRELGLDPGFIEKDYWVTQTLRSLSERYSASIVFKGGSSLSKGYSIIERFSEDVDILVRPVYGASVAEFETRLAEMTEQVASDLGVEWSEKRKPTRGRMASRGDVLAYPVHIAPVIDTPREEAGVLLECGYGDGREPSAVVKIKPMLCETLGIDPAEFADTNVFEIAALAPVRTLLEKVVLLHHVASEMQAGAEKARHERIGRHYHDVDKLLAHNPTLKRLREEQDDCLKILGHIEEISVKQYGGFTPRPDTGYCSGPAFSPERDSELRSWLEERYDAASGLMPRSTPAKWPSFGTVLGRINKHAGLL